MRVKRSTTQVAAAVAEMAAVAAVDNEDGVHAITAVRGAFNGGGSV